MGYKAMQASVIACIAQKIWQGFRDWRRAKYLQTKHDKTPKSVARREPAGLWPLEGSDWLEAFPSTRRPAVLKLLRTTELRGRKWVLSAVCSGQNVYATVTNSQASVQNSSSSLLSRSQNAKRSWSVGRALQQTVNRTPNVYAEGANLKWSMLDGITLLIATLITTSLLLILLTLCQITKEMTWRRYRGPTIIMVRSKQILGRAIAPNMHKHPHKHAQPFRSSNSMLVRSESKWIC